MSKSDSENIKELLKFNENFDLAKKLKELTKEEVREWIEEEWNELIHDHSSSRGEATSIIIDGNHKWMKAKMENELFVYQTLLELNKQMNDKTDDEVMNSLNRSIERFKN